MKKRIPQHRIRSDPTKQLPAFGYRQPPKIYANEGPTCRDCEKEFLFSATKFTKRTKDKRKGKLKKFRKNAEAWLARIGAI